MIYLKKVFSVSSNLSNCCRASFESYHKIQNSFITIGLYRVSNFNNIQNDNYVLNNKRYYIDYFSRKGKYARHFDKEEKMKEIKKYKKHIEVWNSNAESLQPHKSFLKLGYSKKELAAPAAQDDLSKSMAAGRGIMILTDKNIRTHLRTVIFVYYMIKGKHLNDAIIWLQGSRKPKFEVYVDLCVRARNEAIARGRDPARLYIHHLAADNGEHTKRSVYERFGMGVIRQTKYHITIQIREVSIKEYWYRLVVLAKVPLYLQVEIQTAAKNGSAGPLQKKVQFPYSSSKVAISHLDQLRLAHKTGAIDITAVRDIWINSYFENLQENLSQKLMQRNLMVEKADYNKYINWKPKILVNEANCSEN